MGSEQLDRGSARMVAEERLSEELGRSKRKSATQIQQLVSSVGREGLPSGAILQRRRAWVVDIGRLASLQTHGRKQHEWPHD